MSSSEVKREEKKILALQSFVIDLVQRPTTSKQAHEYATALTLIDKH